jgi:hypothetical protein
LNGGTEQMIAEQPLNDAAAFLRVEVRAPDATFTFSFSEDGINFKPIGKPFVAKPDKWVGAKVGLFCSSKPDVRTGSYTDVDWFRITK